jgi:Ala-tRNA(Pro) deacylase
MIEPINQTSLLQFFQEHQIDYQLHEHPPLVTCKDSELLNLNIPGADTKHLFVINKTGQYFLIMTTHEKRLDLAKMKELLGGRVEFGSSEKLKELLNIYRGAVSLLAIINDRANQVRIIADEELANVDSLQQHPLDNCATVVLKREDFLRYFSLIERQIEWQKLPERQSQ